jgi:hypothetical protein
MKQLLENSWPLLVACLVAGCSPKAPPGGISPRTAQSAQPSPNVPPWQDPAQDTRSQMQRQIDVIHP